MFGFLAALFGGNKNGTLKRVENKKKHARANSSYILTKLQWENGDQDYYLFTDNDLKIAKERAQKNPEDLG